MGEQRCTIDQNISERLNVLRFIFMIMVVFIHSEALPELPFGLKVPKYLEICKDVMTNGICAMAVPGFFFISGFLLFSREFTWIGNMKKKVRSILLPYFLVNSFWILFFKVMQSVEVTAAYFAGEEYQIIGIEGIIRAYCDPIPLYYPFWFLRDLLILNVFANLIRILIDKLPVISMLMITIVCFDIVTLPFVVSNASFYMFAIGYYVIKYKDRIGNLLNGNILHVGLGFTVFTICKLYLGRCTVMFMPLYTLSGMLFYYLLAGYIRKCKAASKILWCSQFTFFIYAFHEFYEAMIKKAIMMTIPQYGSVQLLEYFMLPVVISVVCIIVGVVMKKRIPRLYRLLCGGR